MLRHFRPAPPGRPGGRAAIAAFILAVLTSCDSPLTPIPIHGAPQEFTFAIGGFGTGSDSWELRGDTLFFVHVPWGESVSSVEAERIVPSAADWERFWSEVRPAGVHRWRGRHTARNIADGVGWSLSLQHGRLRVAAQGSNAYPDSDGRWHEADTTEAFRRFLHALQDLSGQPAAGLTPAGG